ncbi:MAG TPA: hypothetical protein VE130_10525 [Nitrososphaeraceae archaeon]|nr:hypothetical protein [Nitrososphaeraceae archaeon]
MNNINNEAFEYENESDSNEKRSSNGRRKRETKHEKRVMWRRNKVLTLLTQGCSTYEIAEVLRISQATASRDVIFLRKQAEQELQLHVKSLPHQFQMAYRGLSQILKYAWGLLMSESEGQRNNNKVAILSLITDVYSKRMELCTNAGVIKESLEYVERTRDEVMRELHDNKEKNEEMQK